MTFNKSTNSKGFTLVELLVVVAILATLAAISMAAFNAFYRDSQDRVTRTRLDAIDSAIARYLSVEGGFPASWSAADVDGGTDSSEALYEILYREGADPDNDDDFSDGISSNVYREELAPDNDLTDNQGWVKKINDKMIIIDAHGNPLRFYFNVALKKGKKNNFPNGYDLWSAGQDFLTEDDPDDIPSEDETEDDITNWGH